MLATLFAVCMPAVGQDPIVRVNGSLIEGPAKPDDFNQWFADMKMWRHEQLTRIGYDDAEYRRPELKWTQSSFMQPQMMIEDRYFYDPIAGRYTVDRYLDDLNKRYGGIDSVLIWPTYPNIGIDSRNQFDIFTICPAASRDPADDRRFSSTQRVAYGFLVMLWDQGTHDLGAPDGASIAEHFAEVGADGDKWRYVCALCHAVFEQLRTVRLAIHSRSSLNTCLESDEALH